MKTIAVMEEDEVTMRVVGALLKRVNLNTLLSARPERDLEKVCLCGLCLVLMNSPLPGMRDAELSGRIDISGVQPSIGCLSSDLETPDKILPLASGSDARLPCPLRECDLIARIQAVLPRSAKATKKSICFGDVQIDIEHRHIRRSGKPVKMTPNEYKLLLFFVSNVDQALTRDVILNEVWGYDCYPNTRTVDAHIVKLRRKLEPDPRVPRYLLTIHGVGYRFVMCPADVLQPESSSTSWQALTRSDELLECPS